MANMANAILESKHKNKTCETKIPMQTLNPHTRKETSNSELELHLIAGSVKSECQTVNHNAKLCYQTDKQNSQKKIPPQMKIFQRALIGPKVSDFMRNPVLCAQRHVESKRASLT